MNRLLWALALTAVMQSAMAADSGPSSGPCTRALAALQAREAELAGAQAAERRSRVTTDARWQMLRKQAARACLGGEDAAAPLPQSARPPIAVQPVTPPTAATALPRTPSPTPAAPAIVPRPSSIVTSCDANGCWTSDGARLPRVGRDPVHPTARCSVQGQLVMCL
jgi:hypothetical protein